MHRLATSGFSMRADDRIKPVVVEMSIAVAPGARTRSSREGTPGRHSGDPRPTAASIARFSSAYTGMVAFAAVPAGGINVTLGLDAQVEVRLMKETESHPAIVSRAGVRMCTVLETVPAEVRKYPMSGGQP